MTYRPRIIEHLGHFHVFCFASLSFRLINSYFLNLISSEQVILCELYFITGTNLRIGTTLIIIRNLSTHQYTKGVRGTKRLRKGELSNQIAKIHFFKKLGFIAIVEKYRFGYYRQLINFTKYIDILRISKFSQLN